MRILVLKPCCLGDVLLATPLAAALAAAWPTAVLDWAVDRHSLPALANNPHVAGRLDATGCVRGNWRPAGLARLLLALRRGRYDLAFIPERSPVMAGLPALAGIPRRVGLDSGGRGRWHTVRVPVPATVASSPGGAARPATVAPRHEAELYLDLARAVGLQPGPPALVFRPTRGDQLKARRALAALLTEGPPGATAGAGRRSPSVEVPRPDAAIRGPDTARASGQDGMLVAVHLGGGVNPGMTLAEKRWPPERWGPLLDRLQGHQARIVVLGGPRDREYVDAVRAGTGAPLLDLAGRLTLGEVAAVLQTADLYVGHDTGVSHLATAVGAPAVVIFGPTDPRRYGPLPGTGIAVAPAMGAVDSLAAAQGSVAIRAVGVEEVWRACQAVGRLVRAVD